MADKAKAKGLLWYFADSLVGKILQELFEYFPIRWTRDYSRSSQANYASTTVAFSYQEYIPKIPGGGSNQWYNKPNSRWRSAMNVLSGCPKLPSFRYSAHVRRQPGIMTWSVYVWRTKF